MTANVATSTRYQDPRSAVVVVVIVVAVRCHDDGGDCPKVPFRGEMGEEGIRTPKKEKVRSTRKTIETVQPSPSSTSSNLPKLDPDDGSEKRSVAKE